MKFIPDFDAERAMTTLGFEWVIDDKFPIARINLPKSEKYNPRFTELNQTKIGRLVKHIEADHDFKRVVVLEKDRDALLLGGNHRTHAFNTAGKKLIGAYLVHSNDEAELTLLSHQLNLDIGAETEEEGLLLQAVDMVTRFGASIKVASEKYLVPEYSIRSILHSNEIRRLASSMGFNLHKASGLTLEKLYSLKGNEPVLKRMFAAVRDNNLHGIKLEDTLRLIKREKSEAGKLAAIDKYLTSIGVVKFGKGGNRGGGIPHSGPKARIKSLVGQLYSLLGDKSAKALGFNSLTEDKIAMSLFGKLGKRLTELSKERIGEF